ncbi:hypothetical protein FACS1894196_1580 [Clostridia bacterium]|nr:hypothetical protein FACS1894196_1580 [Clostridia bacterium]
MDDDTNLPGEAEMPDGEALALEESARALADYLYKRTALWLITAKKSLLLSPPTGVEKETLAALLAGIGTVDAHPALLHAALTTGKKDAYYYDESIMTRHYAELSALLEDKDILATIAQVTRSDCKLYPCPTQYRKLMDVPFRFTKDEILGAVARMKNEEAYQDIGVVTASNGASGLYSEQFMTRRYAQALIERIEVEDPANP